MRSVPPSNTPNPVRSMESLQTLLLGVCCLIVATASFAGTADAPRHARKHDRLAHVDTLRDSTGAAFYRIRCTDITVRVRNGAWLPADSTLFFSEHHKVEEASVILKSQVDHLRDSLQHLSDSASAYISTGRFTRASLEAALGHVQEVLQATVNTHNYSLRRLEDYQAVLNAVRPLLHSADSH